MCFAQVSLLQWRLECATRHVENIRGLGKTCQRAAQAGHEFLAFSNRQAEMSGTRSEVGVMEIIGLYSQGEEAAHEVL